MKSGIAKSGIAKSGIAAALAAAGLSVTLGAADVRAETLRFAFQGPLNSLDPYTLNETFTLGLLGNVYEGLTRRGANLEILPALAERWEVAGPNRWRFYLRQGVTFQNGNDFTAEDVVFSATRVRDEGSDLKSRLPADVKVEAVDDYTVDFVTEGPNPILYYEWDTWYIMDKDWAEQHGAVKPTTAADLTKGHAAFNANGTGAFVVDSHEPGVKTILKPNADWWDSPQHNLTEVIFTPIASNATRVAALLSGEIDFMYPVPTQDIARVDGGSGTAVLAGPELRTIFLGMDQLREELLYSDVKGKNPFKDKRVRQAFYHAIDIEAIGQKVMRGLSTPSAIMISPFLFAHAEAFERLEHDPGRARQLLEEAGYGEGFEVGMDCPNDRYVNDEAICQAVSAMLAKIGVEVKLNAQPKALYFAKVLAAGGYDTSFYLLGWTPGSFDSWNVLHNLHGCRNEAGEGGPFNLGGYCNAEVDALTAQILVETDADKRNDLIRQAYALTTGDTAYIPLHQQGLAWGVREGTNVVQRADNQVMLYRITKD
ncbi:MAG: ABC transporter substrate-binding protein [Rhodospirillales bacterium]|nr:ABC transporter substrate-binding protein [Rhodospirillales bacterium]